MLRHFQVVDDIYLQLKLKKPVAKFKSSCFRKNLFYDIRFKEALEDPFEELKDFVIEALGDGWEENRSVSLLFLGGGNCGMLYVNRHNVVFKNFFHNVIVFKCL